MGRGVGHSAPTPPKTQLNEVTAKESTYSHFRELTIDQFCGTRVLYKALHVYSLL